jgi:hypothetical protein
MTARTCCVFLGAGGVLAAGLVGGLAAYLQGGLPAAAAQGRPDQFRYIPADAHLVAFADVRAVMTSDLRARMQERQPEDDGLDFESRTGIRVASDIDEAVACLTPDPSDAANLLVILSGRFDQERLESLAVEHGGTVFEYAGHKLVATTVGNSRLAMAFVEPGVLAVGSEALVLEAIDLADGGDNVTANARLMTLLSMVDPGSNAWAVGELDRPGADAWMPEGLDPRALRVTAFSVAGRVNGGIRLRLQVETPDEAASQNLRDILQGFIALARMQADAQPEVAGILDTVQLRAAPGEHFVSLSMTLPSATVEWLWDRALDGAGTAGSVEPDLPRPPAGPAERAPEGNGPAPPG